jgi:hypothetical protein
MSYKAIAFFAPHSEIKELAVASLYLPGGNPQTPVRLAKN